MSEHRTSKSARLLAEYLRKHQLEQVEIAVRLNVDQSAVSRWLTGEFRPKASNLFRLEKEFGIPASGWCDE